MSYTKVINLITEISVEMKDLFRRSDNNLLPSQLRKGIFTVMVDDNLDANSSSISATMHFHGAGITMLQYPSDKNSGEVREKKRFAELHKDEQIEESSAVDM